MTIKEFITSLRPEQFDKVYLNDKPMTFYELYECNDTVTYINVETKTTAPDPENDIGIIYNDRVFTLDGPVIDSKYFRSNLFKVSLILHIYTYI